MGAASVVDHYERLKISRDAPLEVIRAAYRALAAKHHPDRHGQSEGANTDMAALNAAYEVLCDPEARAVYDATLSPAGAASMFGAEPPDIHIQPTRRARAKPRPDPSGEADTEFQPDIDWSALVVKPSKVNPWLTSRRLVPLGGVVVAMVVGGTYWWSLILAEQMDSERLLANSYQAQAKANAALSAASEASADAVSSQVSAASRPAAALPPLRPLRHVLDGEALLLKPEVVLVDPLGKP